MHNKYTFICVLLLLLFFIPAARNYQDNKASNGNTLINKALNA